MLPAFLLRASQILGLPGSLASSQQILSSQPTCTDFDVSVNVQKSTPHSFVNVDYSLEVLYALASKQILVSNEYRLSARLCEPSTKNLHSDSLQLLIHGATFNKHMWDSQYEPETYNWVRRMNQEGYPTLAFDLPGNGNSTFPDGLLEAQTQVYVETTHEVVQKLRNGEIGGRKWEKIALVGFSIGAIAGNSLAQQYPEDVDAIVFHGVSWDGTWVYPAFLAGIQGPANQIDPDRWGHLQPTYQTQTTRDGRKAACFAGSFDEGILEYDWQMRDFDSLGAAITFVYHLVEAPQYTGPVFLGIGDRDSTFCGGEICGSQPYGLYDKFPKSKAHDVKVYPDTAHLIIYHKSAPALMADSLAFLENNGF